MIGILAGSARFLQRLLDGCAAEAEYSRHELAHDPEQADDNDSEVDTARHQMRLMDAQTRFTRQPTDGRGVLEIHVLFLVFSGRLAGLMGQLSADGLLVGSGLVGLFWGRCGSLLGRRCGGWLLGVGWRWNDGQECEERE